MSVLNTMLRDLERRGERLPLSLSPQANGQSEAKKEVASAPPAPPLRATPSEPIRPAKRRVRPGILLAATAAGCAAVWLWLHPGKHQVQAPLPAAANAPQVAPPVDAPSAAIAPAPAFAPAGASAGKPAEGATAAVPEQSAAPVAGEPPAPAPAPAAASADKLAGTAPTHAFAAFGVSAGKPAAPAPTPAFAPVGVSAGKPAAPMHPHSATPVAKPDTAAGSDETAAAVQSVAPSELARAIQLIGRGRNIDAADLLTSALSQRPGWNEARSTLAALQAEAGERPRALMTLLGGVPFDARRFAPMAAQLQAELGDPAGALQTLEKVPAEARDQTYHNLVAAVAQRAGNHDLAVAEYQAALRLGPTNSVAWVGLGVSLQALRRDAEALAAYRSAAAGSLGEELRTFTQARIRVLQASPQAASTSTR
jgi:MSHA biogenesis protein MshN